jgi:hypothetical protein
MGKYDSYMAIELAVEYLHAVKDKMGEAIDDGYYDWNSTEVANLKWLVMLCGDVLDMHETFKQKDIKALDTEEDLWYNN